MRKRKAKKVYVLYYGPTGEQWFFTDEKKAEKAQEKLVKYEMENFDSTETHALCETDITEFDLDVEVDL